jgi:hypothetical protein
MCVCICKPCMMLMYGHLNYTIHVHVNANYGLVPGTPLFVFPQAAAESLLGYGVPRDVLVGEGRDLTRPPSPEVTLAVSFPTDPSP